MMSNLRPTKNGAAGLRLDSTSHTMPLQVVVPRDVDVPTLPARPSVISPILPMKSKVAQICMGFTFFCQRDWTCVPWPCGPCKCNLCMASKHVPS